MPGGMFCAGAPPVGGAGAACAVGAVVCGWSCVACTPVVAASTAAVNKATAAAGESREVSFTWVGSSRSLLLKLRIVYRNSLPARPERTKINLPSMFLGPERHSFPASAKRNGNSTACRMPIRRVTSTRVTRIPSSRTCKVDLGSSKSRPLCFSRVRPRAWHNRPGPLVNSHALPRPFRVVAPFFSFAVAKEKGGSPRFRAICSIPATGSNARSSTPPPCPSLSHEKFMQK